MEKELPKGWILIQLGDLFLIERGGSPRPIEDYITQAEDGINWIKIGDTKGLTKYIYKTKEKIKPEGLYKSRMVYEDDFILSNSMSFGRPYIMKTSGCIHDGWLVIRPNKKIVDLNYLYYMLSSTFVYQQFSSLAKGSTVKNLNIVAVQQVYIYLPPLPEQQRIVAKLDTLFGHLDTLKTRLDRIPQLLKDFRQKVLTQAVTGKLTEEFDNKKILEVIRKDRKQWYLKQLELSNKTGCKKPKKIKYSIEEGKSDAKSILSKDYDVAFIEEIAAKRENALKAGPFGSSLKKEFYVASGYKIYGQEQVIKGDPFYGDYYINQEKFDSLRSCEVNEGDILISLVGTIGRVLIVPAVFEKGIINPRLVKISLHELICPEYFSIYIKSPVAKELLVKMSHGGTMDVINLDILKRLPVPIPSLQEQQEIVRRVESLFAKADQIETSYQKLKAKIEQLPQALLAKAFRGELVEQLPTDGDARDLLEEIKLAKEGLEKGGKSKKLKAEDEVRMVAEDGARYGK